MLERFYRAFVLKYPRSVIAAVLIATLLLATQAVKLHVDASSETLLLENDPDLAYSRLVSERYRSPDFLVVTYTPRRDLLAPETLEDIHILSERLLALDAVENVTSILNIPLLQSPPKPVEALLQKIPTIGAGDANLTLAAHELRTNPLYASNIVSPDLKTTALQINLKYDARYYELLDGVNELRALRRNGTLGQAQAAELDAREQEFRDYRDAGREKMHRTIRSIREILREDTSDAQLFLGGVDMIADDMITFVKRDLKTYGTIVLLLLIIVLWTVFRQKRWVIQPVILSAVSILITVGILGMLGMEITVVSSNFISLQLIISISVIIHLIVRYREQAHRHPDASQYDLVLASTLAMFRPTFFAIITTIAGFASLMLSDIKPVISMGWMMSIGIAVSLAVTYLLFPAINVLLKKKKPFMAFESEFLVTRVMAVWVERHGWKILAASLLVTIFSVTGAFKLIVENSFISYFKSTTEIYRGMSVIDRQLGGTTPLDVTIDLPQIAEAAETASAPSDDVFGEFEAEYEAEATKKQYWFTDERMEIVRKAHEWLQQLPHVGKVLSLGTMLEVGKTLNDGKPLGNFELALLYNELPEKFAAIILKPYVDIEHNQVRFALRIVDSDPDLRRNALLEHIRDTLPKIVNLPSEQVHLSGIMVLYNNMLQSLYDSQIATLGIMALLLFAMFWLLFGSLRIAVVAIIANLVPIGVIFGFMGWMRIPLDMMTITIAAISIGIAVDDTIHYLYRIRNEFAKDGSYLAAMHRSHESIGYAMTYTSAAIIIGFLILVLSQFIPTIYFGLLTVLAMFMAIVADLLLLPKLILLIRPFGPGHKDK